MLEVKIEASRGAKKEEFRDVLKLANYVFGEGTINQQIWIITFHLENQNCTASERAHIKINAARLFGDNIINVSFRSVVGVIMAVLAIALYCSHSCAVRYLSCLHKAN